MFRLPNVADTGQPQGISWEDLVRGRALRDELGQAPGGQPSPARGAVKAARGLMSAMVDRSERRRSAEFNAVDAERFRAAIGDDATREDMAAFLSGRIGRDEDAMSKIVSGRLDGLLNPEPEEWETHKAPDGSMFQSNPAGETRTLWGDNPYTEAMQRKLDLGNENAQSQMDDRTADNEREDRRLVAQIRNYLSQAEHREGQREIAQGETDRKAAADGDRRLEGVLKAAREAIALEAKLQGRPGFVPKGQTINVNNGGDDSYWESMGEEDARHDKSLEVVLMGDSDNIGEFPLAKKTLDDLDIIEQAMADPNYRPGPLQPYLDWMRGVVVQATGSDSLKANQTLDAKFKEIVLAKIGGDLGHQISDKDREFIENTFAKLTGSKFGNAMIVAITRRFFERVEQKGAAWQKAKMENRSLPPNERVRFSDFSAEWDARMRETPLFDEGWYERKTAEIRGGHRFVEGETPEDRDAAAMKAMDEMGI